MSDYTLDRKKLLDVLRVAIVTDELGDDYLPFIIDVVSVLTAYVGGKGAVRYDHVTRDILVDIERDEKILEGQENIYDKFDILD